MDSFCTNNEHDTQLTDENRNEKTRKHVGVYGLICDGNKVIYVGSSVNLRRRLTSHHNHLRRNIHCNKWLQHSVNKYKTLRTTILETIKGEYNGESLLEREIYWVYKMREDSSGFQCANLSVPVNTWDDKSGKFGRDFKQEYITSKRKANFGTRNMDWAKTPEHRQRMSKIMTGRKITWNAQLLESRHKRPLQVYSIYYTIQTPSGEIVVVHTWENLKTYLKEYNNTNKIHRHKRIGPEQLIKNRSHRGFTLLQLKRINALDGKEVIKYQSPAYLVNTSEHPLQENL